MITLNLIIAWIFSGYVLPKGSPLGNKVAYYVICAVLTPLVGGLLSKMIFSSEWTDRGGTCSFPPGVI